MQSKQRLADDQAFCPTGSYGTVRHSPDAPTVSGATCDPSHLVLRGYYQIEILAGPSSASVIEHILLPRAGQNWSNGSCQAYMSRKVRGMRSAASKRLPGRVDLEPANSSRLRHSTLARAPVSIDSVKQPCLLIMVAEASVTAVC